MDRQAETSLSDREVRVRTHELESRKIEMQDANWSMRWTGLVLLTIGKPFWFWSPLVLVAVSLGAMFFFQAILVGLAPLALVFLEEWYVEYWWTVWVEEYNAGIDAQIERLRKG